MIRLWLFLFLVLRPWVSCGQTHEAPNLKQRLEQAISKYQKMSMEGRWHTLPDTLLLRPGQESRFVPLVQGNLLQTGDLPIAQATASETMSPALATALKRFQARHGLKPDGYLGRETIRAMNVSPYHRLLQLQQNLTRLDTLSGILSQPYILINIPDYSLQVIDSNKTQLRMGVIVGKPALPTWPVQSKLNMLVLRPNWYLPRSISVNEIVPLLRRNPGYLARKRMQLQKQNAAGEYVPVNPWRVKWAAVNNSNFDYRIVQLPSRKNELGQVKFLFPNKVAQYLHDTPYKELFSYGKRAFSHGCVRLEKPDQLADYLLQRSGYTPQKITQLKRTYKPDNYLMLRQPLPLLIVYLTAWADEKKQVQFREDVYGWDSLPQLIGSE